ncbi:MAG: threonine synthase [Verrucomicrobiota bacterium]|nr:threonine synthase [Verrucomicrobiota bacterium]
MRFLSTRGSAPPLSFADAFASGLAPDGGLYVPERLPSIEPLLEKGPTRYPELAAEFFKLFDEDHSAEEINELFEKSYSSFEDPDNAAPLIELSDDTYVLELFHGPTFAFKDFGLQLVGNMFEEQIARTGKVINVLGATSGDTGSAAIHGLADKEGARVFVLYPEGRISDIQERQMTCTGSDNIFPISIEGSFDDAQRIVKDLFEDLEFKGRARLSAVNSINLARILAQCVYYIHAYQQLPEGHKDSVRYVVPTGNFGNVLAGWLAGQMGLPVEEFTGATNQNDLLYRLFTEGIYEPKKVNPSLAPSMDIQVASNFERFLHYHLDGDGQRTSEIMNEIKKGNELAIPGFNAGKFSATRTDDSGIIENIRKAKDLFNYVPDPHTSCCFNEVTRSQTSIMLATAHPAKFPETITKAINESPTHPSLERLRERTPQKERLPANTDAIREYLEENILQ